MRKSPVLDMDQTLLEDIAKITPKEVPLTNDFIDPT